MNCNGISATALHRELAKIIVTPAGIFIELCLEPGGCTYQGKGRPLLIIQNKKVDAWTFNNANERPLKSRG